MAGAASGELTGGAGRRVAAARLARLGEWIPWVVIVGLGAWAAIALTDQFVIGVIVGSLYALSAVGLTLIYGIARVSHFAQGDAMMLFAYLAFFVMTGTVAGIGSADATLPLSLDLLPGASEKLWRFSFGYGLILAVIAAALLAVPILLAIDRVVYQPLQRRGASTAIVAVASLGVAITMRGAMLLIWGPGGRRYAKGIRDTVDLPGLPRIVADQLFIIGMAAVLAAATYLLLYRTRLGTAMRATADNPDLARASGIDTAATRRWTWAIGGALTAVAGCLLALQSQLSPELGFVLLLPIFAAAILGGIGSPHGAFIGGLIVGIIGEVTVGAGIVAPGYKLAVTFVVLILVILRWPNGLFGARS
ncbi:MAG: branched-chain amino acid ABC transporter permease [Thermomicrobiales bacterium]|nr:branched-chain amino acid ABC transporter permease [Thermomicrobiales bacterium]